MRRCGRASCVLVIGLLTAAFAAGGAFAGAGGHGNKGGQGKGNAWAKGHVKHAAATPQLASPQAEPQPDPEPKPDATPEPKASPAAASASPSAPPGAATRHHHVTICHATGSGYIVISPNVNGVVNGHMKHHYDFLYVDGCGQPAGVPGSNPPGDPPPPTHEPRDPPSPSPPGATPSGDLPFTGLSAIYLLFAGSALVAGGLALRRQKSI